MLTSTNPPNPTSVNCFRLSKRGRMEKLFMRLSTFRLNPCTSTDCQSSKLRLKCQFSLPIYCSSPRSLRPYRPCCKQWSWIRPLSRKCLLRIWRHDCRSWGRVGGWSDPKDPQLKFTSFTWLPAKKSSGTENGSVSMLDTINLLIPPYVVVCFRMERTCGPSEWEASHLME